MTPQVEVVLISCMIPQVEVVLTVPPSDPLHESRGRILYNLGKAPFSSVVLNKKDFPLQVSSKFYSALLP
jgi:hypothetical protein